MTTIAVVPVKRLSDVKTRLADRLTSAERRALVLDLLDHVLAVLAASSSIDGTIVVSPDPEIIRDVDTPCTTRLLQPDDGLNQAIRLGRAEALKRGATGLLVVLADLPLIAVEDIDAMVKYIGDNAVVLAPDRHEHGTNAMAISPADAIEPAFGQDSLRHHRLAASERGLTTWEYRSQGTGFDIDMPADFEDFQRLRVPWR